VTILPFNLWTLGDSIITHTAIVAPTNGSVPDRGPVSDVLLYDMRCVYLLLGGEMFSDAAESGRFASVCWQFGQNVVSPTLRLYLL